MNSQFRIATYNLRYANNKDIGNLWVDRSPVVVNLIRFHEFDILATQEGLKSPLNDISSALTFYERYGVARDDGQNAGEHCAIFYNREKFTFLNGGNFWLSEHPDVPGFGWDARHNRICTWVQLLQINTATPIYFFNAHFDHYSIKAREASSTLVLSKIRELTNGEPCILAGDFNSDHETQAYKTLATPGLLQDVYKMAEHPYINNPSFNSWGQPSSENRLIDHLFVTEQFAVKKYGILTDTYFSKMPSDHFPVMADIYLRQ